jgi:hypothetical protein
LLQFLVNLPAGQQSDGWYERDTGSLWQQTLQTWNISAVLTRVTAHPAAQFTIAHAAAQRWSSEDHIPQVTQNSVGGSVLTYDAAHCLCWVHILATPRSMYIYDSGTDWHHIVPVVCAHQTESLILNMQALDVSPCIHVFNGTLWGAIKQEPRDAVAQRSPS